MINIEKARTISSFFADNVDGLFITKLMKLFYYTDFLSYAERGSSVTNDIYYKLPYGPVPSFIKNEIDTLIEPSLIENESKSQLSKNIMLDPQDIGGKKGYLVVNINKQYNLRELSPYELSLIKRIASKFKRKTGKELTSQSHKESPYLETSENSPIDYELAKKLNVSKILN